MIREIVKIRPVPSFPSWKIPADDRIRCVSLFTNLSVTPHESPFAHSGTAALFDDLAEVTLAIIAELTPIRAADERGKAVCTVPLVRGIGRTVIGAGHKLI